MPAIKVKATQFTGTSKVFSRDPDGLAAIIRGIAIDNANLKVQVAAVHDFIDNSTGVATSPPVLPNLTPLVDGVVDATTLAVGANLAALNTSLGKLQNACKVMTNTLNVARSLIGLTALTCAVGTQVTVDTIPAQDKTNATASGTSAANFASAYTALAVGAANVYLLAEGANEVLTAIGALNVTLPKVPRAYGQVLSAIPAVVADTTGASSASQADVQGWLIAVSQAIATLAATWNVAMTQSDTTPLNVIAG